jgi:hypothetical protein
VAGWSVHVPGLPEGSATRGWLPGAACAPEDASTLLGRKGLLYKEPATRLALCAVHTALSLAPGTRRSAGAAPDPGTAVVASSNLGNLATVCSVARAVRAEGVRAVSPMDAPNVSSNVIASTVAIWFGFGGPNLMVCSGHPAGLDAVRLAQLLLSAGRADRVVVVGAEPGDETARSLLGGRPALRAAAACVILRRAESGSLPVVEPVADIATPPETGSSVVIGSAGGPSPVDLTVHLGQTYGALGVLQVAVAAAMVGLGVGPVRVICGDAVDGYRTTTVSRTEEPR